MLGAAIGDHTNECEFIQILNQDVRLLFDLSQDALLQRSQLRMGHHHRNAIDADAVHKQLVDN